ncbi:MAG: hypothetical protein ACLP5H_33300 [Desulfomonilaceae bacterium]
MGDFISFIQDCIGNPKLAGAFYNLLEALAVQTATSAEPPQQTLWNFFNGSSGNAVTGTCTSLINKKTYSNVSVPNCTTLLNAAKAQGPCPPGFQPEY